MTRYPKKGKGHPWTVRELIAIPADWKGDTISDGGGLSGEVRLSADGAISIRFKYAFKWAGKVAWYQCGTYPTVDLAEIRQNRDRARDLVSEGVNPNDQKKAARIEAQAAVEATIAEAKRQATENQTVGELFGVWIVDGVNRKDGNKELRRIFDKNILPVIGAIPLRELTEGDIRNMLRPVISAGTVRKAETMLLGVKQMMAWAEKRPPWRAMLIEGNPADLVPESSVIPADYEGERDRVLLREEIRELRDILERMTAEYEAAPAGFKYQHERPLKATSQAAIWICLGTLCRIGELLMARWEHVDFEARTWFIPKENVKGARGKKQAQTVYLSDFTLQHFQTLRGLTGKTPWLFPAKNIDGHVCVSSVSKQIGDRQERFMDRKPLKNRKHNNTLVLSAGKNGKWTIHDLRRTGATMMQGLGVSLDVIDRCQNHVIAGSKVRRHYLHHDYADEKREAWERLGAELERVLGE